MLSFVYSKTLVVGMDSGYVVTLIESSYGCLLFMCTLARDLNFDGRVWTRCENIYEVVMLTRKT